MTQPLGNCPGCDGDEPFEQLHASGPCPDDAGECPEWMCAGCGAGVFLGLVITGTASVNSATSARQPARAA